jgi:hypothetical protein
MCTRSVASIQVALVRRLVDLGLLDQGDAIRVLSGTPLPPESPGESLMVGQSLNLGHLVTHPVVESNCKRVEKPSTATTPSHHTRSWSSEIVEL